jgi:deoxyribonuclease IV
MAKSDFKFGTVGSPISTPKKPGGSVGAIQQIAALDLSALELGWVQAVRVTEETCSLIKTEAEKLKVSISVHAPYFINLNADDEEWPKSRKRLMDAAKYGYLAGATDIIFHPGSYFGKPVVEVMEVAMVRLSDCACELRKSNILVNLRPETMGKSAMLGSLEDTILMSQVNENVRPCLDFAHLHARPGDGTINSYAEWSQILDQYGRSLGADALKELHIHLSGIQYGPKGEKEHLPIRESDLDITGLIKALRDHHCGGRIMCESPILEDDALYMKKLWEEG